MAWYIRKPLRENDVFFSELQFLEQFSPLGPEGSPLLSPVVGGDVFCPFMGMGGGDDTQVSGDAVIPGFESLLSDYC